MSVDLDKLAKQVDEALARETSESINKWIEERRRKANTGEKQCNLPVVSERFSSEGEVLQWIYLNTPLAIKPKSKHAKTLLVNSFTSNHAFEEVCKHLANKLYNAR